MDKSGDRKTKKEMPEACCKAVTQAREGEEDVADSQEAEQEGLLVNQQRVKWADRDPWQVKRLDGGAPSTMKGTQEKKGF